MVALSHLKVIIFLSIFIAVLSIAGFIALIVLWHTKLTPFKDFALVVDAGSTHSKIFLYQWPADKSDGLGLTSRVTQNISCDVPGGAITDVNDTTLNGAQQYFESAMSKCMSQIPSTRKSRAPIFLGGTAGLRLFEMKDANYTNNLLNGVRAYFSTLGLLFKAPEEQVRIISGSEEGLSGWISTNMLMGELLKNNKPLETYGVSDMGGASTQISFIAPGAINDRFSMNLFDTEYDVYSHSYLCYGTEQLRYVYLAEIMSEANGSLISYDPCLQSDYNQTITYADMYGRPCVLNAYPPSPDFDITSNFTFIGTGNSTECSQAVRKRFDTTNCTSPSCSFNNVYQPKPIPASLKFIAISAWFTTFNSLAPNVSLSPNKNGNYDFESVNFTQIHTAIDKICNQPWSDLPNPELRYRPLLCFNSMYHWTLLEYGYSMKDDNLKNFHIVKTIDNNDIGWTLGYMINQTNNLDPEKRPPRLITKSEFGGLLFLSLFLLLASVIAAIIALKQCSSQDGGRVHSAPSAQVLTNPRFLPSSNDSLLKAVV